jgi:hypothetical protein
MPRKENKLRPYRVDYFDLNEMNAADQALVQSTIVRAVTAFEAADLARTDNGVWNEGRTVIRAHRYYKPLKYTPTFKNLEDLFPPKWVPKVKASIEDMRKLFESRRIDKQFAAMATDDDYRKLMQELNPAFDFGAPAPKVIDPGPNCWSGGLKIPFVPATGQGPDYVDKSVCGTAEIASRNNYADPDHHVDLDEVAPIVNPAPPSDCKCSFAFPVSSSAMELHMIAAHGHPDTGQVATAVEEAMSAVAPEHGDVISEAVTQPLSEFCGLKIAHEAHMCDGKLCQGYAEPTGQVLVTDGSYQPASWKQPLPTWVKVGLFGLVVAVSVVAILAFGR